MTKKPRMIDYSKPPRFFLVGKEGLEIYLKILRTPNRRYDAKKHTKKAKEFLREQGLTIE